SASRLRVEESLGSISVDTGSASFAFDRRKLKPFTDVRVKGAPVIDGGRSGIVFIPRNSWRARAVAEDSGVAVNGPGRATPRLAGRLERRRSSLGRFVARISLFRGLSIVRVDLTIHNPRRARHANGLWDLGDPRSLVFRSLNLSLGLLARGPCET